METNIQQGHERQWMACHGPKPDQLISCAMDCQGLIVCKQMSAVICFAHSCPHMTTGIAGNLGLVHGAERNTRKYYDDGKHNCAVEL